MSEPHPAALSPQEAAQALSEVDRVGRRSQAYLFSAGMAAPLMIWGVVWLVCNGVTQYRPDWAFVWFPGVAIGIAGSVMSARRTGLAPDRRRSAALAAMLAFYVALVMALGLRDPAAQNLLISLIVAASYVFTGLWRSARMAWLGVVLAGLTLVGWFVVRDWFALWMGVVGGGALLLSGLWLRRL